jgi:hypothetical protein
MKFKNIYEGNPSFQTKVNVNPKNDEKRMKENLQKLHVQKNHTSFIGNLLCQ